jgi:multidrug efflux pump subunit AcrB
LTYTLVPTMAHFLLRNQHHHSTRSEDAGPPPKGFFARFQRGFEHHFERLRQGYLGLLQLALQHRFWFAGGFLCVALLSLGLAPFLGQDFFPSIDAGAIRIHMRAPTGTRIEETTRLTDQVEQKIRAIIPPASRASSTTSACRTAASIFHTEIPARSASSTPTYGHAE